MWLVGGGTSTLRSLVESPETGIRRALAGPVGPGATRAVGGSGATVRFDRTKFADLLVNATGTGAEVVAVADAEAVVAWRGQEVTLSYVGRERLQMARCQGGGWCVEGERAPRLVALLSVLVRRADAFADADAERYRPLVADDYGGAEGGKPELLRRLAADLGGSPRARLRLLGWQVRIERETAQVGEDFEIALGAGPARRLRARFDLREEGGRWRFTGGL
jgi:hypothetical protein